MAHLLIHCRRAPYGRSLPRSGIELAMAAAAFDQNVGLLFSGDGVWQLLDHQLTENTGEKNHGKLISALPLYGVDTIYVDSAALSARGLTPADLCLDVQLVDKQGISKLFAESAHILSF